MQYRSFYEQDKDGSIQAEFINLAPQLSQETFDIKPIFNIVGGHQTSGYWMGDRITIEFPRPLSAIGFEASNVGVVGQNLLLAMELTNRNLIQSTVNVDGDKATDVFWGIVIEPKAPLITKITIDQGSGNYFGIDTLIGDWQTVSVTEPNAILGLLLLPIYLWFKKHQSKK